MLLTDLTKIGGRLYDIRQTAGKTQAQLSEDAQLSTRTYADIERGESGMRLLTFLQICEALHVTPNDVLLVEDPGTASADEILTSLFREFGEPEKKAFLRRLKAFLQSYRDI